MARLRHSHTGIASGTVPRSETSSARRSRAASPTNSNSSDKENQQSDRHSSKAMSGSNRQPATKRRRIEDRAGRNSLNTTPRADVELNSAPVNSSIAASGQVYDPHQDPDERRWVRKGLRDLERQANDLRSDWLAPESTGIHDAVKRADTFFNNVKQTSDATIDSRLLVTTSDLTYKKAQRAALGDGAQGVDVDEFVSRCISFMNQGGDGTRAAPAGTQARRRNRTAAHDEQDSDEEEEGDDGDALNWEHLGRQACFPVFSRPAVPGFLLGPLALQKKTKRLPQRRDRSQAQLRAQQEATKPQELKAADLERQQNSQLTTLCKNIHMTLKRFIGKQAQRAEQEYNALEAEPPPEVERQILKKYRISSDGGVGLFDFCINPRSFGQTVENLFYVSFLIRDGLVVVHKDFNGLPTLHYRDPNSEAAEDEQGEEAEHEHEQGREGRKKGGGKRHQAVFSIDYETWAKLIEAFDIESSIIPERSEEDQAPVSATGWYA